MKLSEVLARDGVVVPLEGETVTEALEILGGRLVDAGAASAVEALTGDDDEGPHYRRPGEGVVVAHRSDGRAREFAVAIGIAPEALRAVRETEAGPARVVIAVISPPGDVTLHRRAVDAIARSLEEGRVERRLLSAGEPEDVRGIRELMELVIDRPISAGHAMSDRAFRVYPSTPASEVVDLMVRHSVTAVPVVGEKQEVLGIITVKDVLRQLLPRRRAEERESGEAPPTEETITAKDVMNRTVMCVSEDQDLVDVANLMLNRDVHQIPVVREGVLTGFLGEVDVLRRLFGR